MSYNITTEKSTGSEAMDTIHVSGELCVFHTAEMCPLLLENLQPGSAFQMDLARVNEWIPPAFNCY